VEAFFNPKLSLETQVHFPQSAVQTPFVNAVYQAIIGCKPDKQNEFFNCIVLCGGLASIPGFKERFMQDFKKLKNDFHVLMTKHPQTTVIKGAKIYASLPDFRSRCITRQSYVSNRLTDDKAAFDYLITPELTTMKHE